MNEHEVPELLWARLANPNLRFPRRPRIAPDLDIFTMPDGLGVQFRGGQLPVVIRGPVAEKAMSFLLPLLDGSHEPLELVRLNPPDVTQATLARALVLMHAKGLLVEGEEDASTALWGAAVASPTSGDPLAGRQLLFWGRHLDITRSARHADEFQRTLAAAQIVVVATGLFGVTACDLLMRCGCDSLRILEWDDDGYVEASVGEMAVEMVNVGTRSVDDVSTVLSGWLPVADLVVTATRGGSARFFRAVNRLCLEHRRPWLRGNFDGSVFEIGPYVYPYGSACYSCLELRRASAMDGAIEEQFYQERLSDERPAGTQPPLGEALFAATLGASVLTAEVIRTVTHVAPPTLLDHVSRISPVVGAMETSHVLRVPRCPDCYQGQFVTSPLINN